MEKTKSINNIQDLDLLRIANIFELKMPNKHILLASSRYY